MDYEVSAEIDAAAAQVWAVLADLGTWPEWTRSMREVTPLGDGPVGEGSRVRVRQPSLPTVVWTIGDWQPGHRFTWEASSPGVATAADHELRPDGDRTTVVLRVRQSGLLAPLVHRLIGKRTRTYMQMEADGLKARAEAAHS
jgi:uncharacterized membrane protein